MHLVETTTLLVLALAVLEVPASRLLQFTQEPQDTVTYFSSLVLDCNAGGDPSPTITWYRGDPPVLLLDGHVINGSLVIPNVVEGVDASRGGIPYHCRASSDQLGTIRSRTAMVYYASFGGSSEEKMVTYNVSNASVQQNVALPCEPSWPISLASIIWMNDLNQTIPIAGKNFLYLEGGQYLAIARVDPTTAQRTFHCTVANIPTVDSPIKYKLSMSANSRTGLVVYKELQDVIAYEGDSDVHFSMVVGGSDPTLIQCAIDSSSLETKPLSIQSTVIGLTIVGPVSLADNSTVVSCTIVGSGNTTTYKSKLIVQRRGNLVVTSSPGDSLDNSVGTNVSFTCEAIGLNLVTRWYKNGEEVLNGPHAVVSGYTMTIYGAKEGDSSIYQCSVSNGTSSVWRQWLLKVARIPTMSILHVEKISHEDGSISVTVQVMSYPPPVYVQWYLNGSLVESSALYIISNISVSDNSTVPITYNASLTISRVNLTTQGFYWASFYGHVGVVNTSAVCVLGMTSYRRYFNDSGLNSSTSSAATLDGHYYIIPVVLVVVVMVVIGVAVMGVAISQKRKDRSKECSAAQGGGPNERLEGNDYNYNTIRKEAVHHKPDNEGTNDCIGIDDSSSRTSEEISQKPPISPQLTGLHTEVLYAIPQKKRRVRLIEKAPSLQGPPQAHSPLHDTAAPWYENTVS